MSAVVRASSAVYPKSIMALMFGTGALAVGTYVRTQLVKESNTMDRFFASYNTDASEASRRRTFNGHPDPRTNVLNFLSWQ